MRNVQQAILGSKHKGEKRLKRKRKLSRRVKCHGSKDNHLFHIKKPELQKPLTVETAQYVSPRVIIKKQSWIQKIKEFFLKLIRRK